MDLRLRSLELLESRIAPATLTGQVLTYTDADGDAVTITISKGALLPTMFVFDTGTVDGDNTAHQQLQQMSLTSAAGVDDADITMKVTRAGGGDGFAAVGKIIALGHDLGKITIKGDLGDLDCGSGTIGTPAVKTLTVQSLGDYGTSTQASGGTLDPTINGSLGALKVAGNLENSIIKVSGGDGTIGPITIGGSMFGGSGALSGSITSSGDIGPIKIGHDLVGRSAPDSGKIDSGGKIASITIGGSLVGGERAYDDLPADLHGVVHKGQIFAVGDIGAVKIGHDLTNGTGSASGDIQTMGSIIRGVTVGGSWRGSLVSTGVTLGAVKVAIEDSGRIQASGNITSLTVGGAFGGSVTTTGTGNLGAVKIGRDFDPFSHLTVAGTLASLRVAGSIGDGSTIHADGQIGTIHVAGSVDSTSITGGAGITSISVGGSFVQSSSANAITCAGTLGMLKVGGSLSDMTLEAGALTSARVGSVLGVTFTINGDLGTLQVSHDFDAGLTHVIGKLGNLVVKGAATLDVLTSQIGKISVKGSGTGTITGGAIGTISVGGDLVGSIGGSSITSLTVGGSLSAGISATGKLGKVSVGKDLVDSVSGAGGSISGGHIGSIVIGGSILVATDADALMVPAFPTMVISATDDIGSITVRGDLRGAVGSSGTVSPAAIYARGQANPTATTDVAIGRITIGGTVEHALIAVLANPNAQFGAVRVGGDWIASSLVAGAENRGTGDASGGTGTAADNVNFGDTHDIIAAGGLNPISRIASITIKGIVAGSTATDDHFGFVAHAIGFFKAGRYIAPLSAATAGQFIELSPQTADATFTNGDVSIHEI